MEPSPELMVALQEGLRVYVVCLAALFFLLATHHPGGRQ